MSVVAGTRWHEGNPIRRWTATVALVAFWVVSLFATAHAGVACECAHAPTACHGAHGCHASCSEHEDHAPGEDHDEGECSLCRVLGLVPLEAGLPPSLPAPRTGNTISHPDPVSVASAAVLRLGLARGPPALSRR